MKRKPILLDKVIKWKNNSPRQVIGMIGTHHGAGVTHTGLMLAFYMGEELGKKTAYVECNHNHDMGLLQASYEWNEADEFSFTFHRITCYKDMGPNRIPEILSDDYECVIIDFGMDFAGNREEFLRCGRKVILTGQAEWELRKLESFLQTLHLIHGSDAWIHLVSCINGKALTKLRTKLGNNIYAVPFNPNPILPSSNTCRLFDELFLY